MPEKIRKLSLYGQKQSVFVPGFYYATEHYVPREYLSGTGGSFRAPKRQETAAAWQVTEDESSTKLLSTNRICLISIPKVPAINGRVTKGIGFLCLCGNICIRKNMLKPLLTFEAVSQCGFGFVCEGDYKQLFKEANEQSKGNEIARLMDCISVSVMNT